ncbi:translation initiation factor IF-2 [Patescibacteria group bacterium]|nr:MAG: translation initiation factor IF-2 [Patescibacteria group bacterium]
MAIKLKAAAEKFGFSEREFRSKLRGLGFKIDRKETKIDEGIVTQFERRLKNEEEKKVESKESGEIKTIEIPKVIAVKGLAEKMELPVAKVIKELMKNGMMVTINENIDFETAAIISEDLGFKVKEEKADLLKAAKAGQHVEVDDLLKEDDKKKLKRRPPVVVMIGHVDHGKTTLLDAIRKANVVKGEAGGITQHINTYQVKKKGKLITFIDTPGHEAFKRMRAQGTKITDIAVLVVAADEGVKPQTIEAIKHAKDVKVPIIVAITKVDKPNANVDKVKKELGDYEILSDEWGGKDVFIPVSGMTKEGLDDLLDMILLVSDMEEFKANPKREAVGTVVESNLDKSRGPIATVLVQTGTLRQGDYVVAGEARGKVRFMENYQNRSLKEALPSMPVLVGGFKEVPIVGSVLQAVESDQKARQIVSSLHHKQIVNRLKAVKDISLDELTSRIKESRIKKLRIVLKVDVKGSLEAIKECLKAIGNDEVAINLVRTGIGAISETDIDTAAAADEIVIGFNVNVDPIAKKLAKDGKIKIFQFEVIYELIEKAKELLGELLEPEIIENILGRIKILKVFKTGKKDMIIGGKVTKGKIQPNHLVRILRKGKKIAEGEIDSLQQEKKTVSESKKGSECGVHYKGEPVVKEGDIVEVFSRTEKKRSLK